MEEFDQERRSFLVGLGAIGMGHILGRGLSNEQTVTRPGPALGSTDGEHLIHPRDHGSVFIKIGTSSGSSNLALGTQQVMKGTGIPIHRHFKMDEAFYVLDGSGTFILNDVRHPFDKGASIFIPKNSWHGFENVDRELLLLWVVTPAGLDGFFREICSVPGEPSKQFTRAQISEIALKYDTEFR